MVHPINEIVEANLEKGKWIQKLHHRSDYSTRRIEKFAIYLSRALLVVSLAILASCVPGFGMFASLVGSTVCALISYVLPASFHLILFGSSLHFWQRALDFCILSCGLLFAAYGTYNSIVGI
jgi:proton-coupled amino acid transporter